MNGQFNEQLLESLQNSPPNFENFSKQSYYKRIKKILTLLIQTQKLLNDPVRWSQNALANDKDGKKCSPFSPEAVSWCIMGAIQYLSQIDFKDLSPDYYALKDCLPKSFPETWTEINDDWNHKHMLNFLDQQIKRLQEKIK